MFYFYSRLANAGLERSGGEDAELRKISAEDEVKFVNLCPGVYFERTQVLTLTHGRGWQILK